MENSLVYYDVGAFGGKQFPFDKEDNLKYIKEYIGIDPFLKGSPIDGKSIYYKCVVSDEEEKEKDFYIIKPLCSSSLFCINEIERAKIAGKNAGCNVKKIKVNCRKLSNIINENGGDIDVLKIDAHGSEYVILKDVEKYMINIVAIHIEMWTAQWYEGAVLFKESHEFLKSHSFLPVYVVEPFQGISVDLLYVNDALCDKDKLDFIKELYGVNKKTIEDAEKEVKSQMDYCKKGNFCYQEWLKNEKA